MEHIGKVRFGLVPFVKGDFFFLNLGRMSGFRLKEKDLMYPLSLIKRWNSQHQLVTKQKKKKNSA